MSKQLLIVNLWLNISRVILCQTLTLFFHFFKEKFEILWLHQNDRSPNKFENIDVFTEFHCHIIRNFEINSTLKRFIFQFLVRNDLLAVPSESWNHFFNLWRRFWKIFNCTFDFVFNFNPIWLIICSYRYSILKDQVEKSFLLIVSPSFLVFLAFCFVIKVDFTLILLYLNNCVY